MSLLDWPTSQERRALAEALADMSAGSDAALAEALRQAGIAGIGVPEELGGAGGDQVDLAAAIRTLAGLARSASSVELSLVTAWALGLCGSPRPALPCAPAFEHGSTFSLTGSASALRITGQAAGVPGLDAVTTVLIPVEHEGGWWLALVEQDQAQIEQHVNLAGEARASVRLTDAAPADLLRLPAGVGWTDLHARAGLLRAVQLSGALIAVQHLSVHYARTREQFGKPLAQQQVVAHLLASIAEQSLLAEAAVATAVAAPSTWNSAIAKSVTSRAARSAARAAHQVHGAMGMSQEYELGRLTTRLWSWAEEGGRAVFWEQWIGSQFMQQATPQLWQTIVDGREGSTT